MSLNSRMQHFSTRLFTRYPINWGPELQRMKATLGSQPRGTPRHEKRPPTTIQPRSNVISGQALVAVVDWSRAGTYEVEDADTGLKPGGHELRTDGMAHHDEFAL